MPPPSPSGEIADSLPEVIEQSAWTQDQTKTNKQTEYVIKNNLYLSLTLAVGGS